MDHGVFVMHDDQMFIRVGQEESNLIPMGRMGSGTSWQPASSPMPMLHKQSGEWLLMRTTASVSYNRSFERGNWASSLIWGRNDESHDGEIFNLNGYVTESTVRFLDRNYLYTRLELTDKNQLLRDADRLSLGLSEHHPSFRIGAYTAGGARDIWNTETTSLAIGSDVTFYSKPSILDSLYGANPVSWKLFVRLRPSQMTMSRMHGTH